MSIQKRTAKLPPGLVWRGRTIHIDTTVDGQRVTRSCRTSSVQEARRMLDTLRAKARWAEITGEPARRERAGRITLAAFAEQVLEELRVDRAAPRTIARYRGVIVRFERFCHERLGHPPRLREIDPELVRRYKVHAANTPRTRNGCANGVARPPAPRTICNELDVIRVFLRKAVERGHLRENPERGVGRIKGAYDHRIRWLDEDEIDRLRRAAYTWDDWNGSRRGYGPILGLVIDLYLCTGLRLEELRHLTDEDAPLVDPGGRHLLRVAPKRCTTSLVIACSHAEAGRLRREGPGRDRRYPGGLPLAAWQSLTWHEAQQVAVVPAVYEWRPKTRAREVPLGKRALELLDRIRDWRQALLGDEDRLVRARRFLRLGEPPWLVPDPSGTPWRWKMARVMQRCCQQAGISPVVRTHDLRHTFATQLRRRGVALETIQELLGHKDIAETLMYAHFSPDEAYAAIGLLDGGGHHSIPEAELTA